MSDRNDFSEQIADLLRGQDRLNTQMEELRRENKENTDRTITAFNNFANAILKKLDSVDTQLIKIADMDERLKRLEAEVFKK